MIESVVLWNEPNNLSHWDYGLDPGWTRFGVMIAQASSRLRIVAPEITRVLGGISPLDASFISLMEQYGALSNIDVVGAHGFPFDWNRWHVDEWPARLAPVQHAAGRPVWVTEAGASSFVSDDLQAWALDRVMTTLAPCVDRVYWYALMDLPEQWAATTRHAGSEGNAYYRHYRMGVARADGSLKPAADHLARWVEQGAGVCEWVYWREEKRLRQMVRLLNDLGIRRVRTGIGWADWVRDGATDWFDFVMSELEAFDLAVTLCFTPADYGIEPHHTSPPVELSGFADFCETIVRRYGSVGTKLSPAASGAAGM